MASDITPECRSIKSTSISAPDNNLRTAERRLWERATLRLNAVHYWRRLEHSEFQASYVSRLEMLGTGTAITQK